MTTIKLSVVIVSWNTRDLLAGCVESLLNDPAALELEILVVDNASKDRTVVMLHERYPQVEVIECQRNVGFARANNLGIRRSTGEYVLLLNPDTEVDPGAVAVLLDFLVSNPGVGAVGPRILNPDGSLQYSCSPVPTLKREFRRLFHLPGIRHDGNYEMQNWDQDRPHPTDVLLGACIMLPRPALEQVGFMDEDYFMYTEETDLCYRLKRTGWQLFWLPTAQVVHFGGQSTKQAAREMFLRLYQSKTLFFRKNYGVFTAFIYKLLLFSVSLSRVLLTPIAWLQPSVQRQKTLSQARNYLSLFLALPGM